MTQATLDAKLAESGPLGHVVCERSLRKIAESNDMPGTITELHTLTKIDPRVVEKFVQAAHIEGLIIICKANELEDATFGSLVKLLITQGKINAGDMAATLRRYQAFSAQKAQSMLKPKP